MHFNGLFQLPSPFHAQWTRPVKLFRLSLKSLKWILAV
jgi:hypothetical protein